jgi:hypothetical protein
MKFEDTETYKAGIIDANGNRIKSYNLSTIDGRQKYADYYTPFHRLVFNIKKLMAKVPGGGSRLATYAAALYLMKEKFNVSDKHIQQSLKEVGLDQTDFMLEQSQWFVLSDGRLSPGSYKLANDKVVNSTCEDVVKAKDSVHVEDKCYPVGSIFGLNIYEAIHTRSKQTVYVTTAELLV